MTNDLREALAQIGDIRQQLAAGTLFRGFGPLVVAGTGVLALATASAQSLLIENPGAPTSYFAAWAAAAVIAIVLIGTEMVARTRRRHGGLADAMLFNAVEHFLPAGAAGAVVAAVLLTYAPEVGWVLPGLWQLLLALGLFASTRFLPREVNVAAAWYFLAGAATLMLASQTHALSPWAMGVPFGIGQLLLGLVLHIAIGDGDDAE